MCCLNDGKRGVKVLYTRPSVVCFRKQTLLRFVDKNYNSSTLIASISEGVEYGSSHLGNGKLLLRILNEIRFLPQLSRP